MPNPMYKHQMPTEVLKDQIAEMKRQLSEGEASDGAHTHNELYEHRMWLTIHAVQAWRWWSGFEAVKSRKHADGELCFGGGWFIVMVKLPAGWISYHYEDKHWDLFPVPEVELPPEYDGHTPADVVERMRLSVGEVSAASAGQRLAREEFAKLETRIMSLTEDVSWLLSELGHDHWQECESTAEDCYQCAGYLELKEKYGKGEKTHNADVRLRVVLATVRSQPRGVGPSVHRLPHTATELVASPDVSR